MVLASTLEVNSFASTIKMLPVYGIFSLNGDLQTTLLRHRYSFIQLLLIIKKRN